MLTLDQINFYHDNGYLVVEDVISPAILQHALQAIDEVVSGENSQGSFELEPKDKQTIRRIWSPTKKHPAFWQIATDKDLLEKIADLIGKNITFHYSKLNMKGPKVGSVVEWHQDFSYYPHTNSDLLTVLIALDPMDAENGGLKVIPKSHKLGLSEHYIDGYFRGKLDDIEEDEVVHLQVPAGGAIFLHCLTKHASDRNTSNRSRRTFLPAYRAADAFPIYFGPHASHNEPGAKTVLGQASKFARVEKGIYSLPFAEREFGSIYDIQEGSHLNKRLDEMKLSGYAVD
ncbi:phytanoyl-CoA dioxygenase family protein [uncultured Shewanella sp.]|uniref:phytanoyl-CoA dioxygenase family protein n=1 Tax=uncultured Shewanella sp. TaxID=173975 RepID=UPI00262820CE|nr:phytanoyl-CoA dioxygenase family protein [uncultured Shewanella sp.]